MSEALTKPKLLLHSCCAPCSSYVLLYLAESYDITVYYFNPNIWPEAEYFKRLSEQKRLLGAADFGVSAALIAGDYDETLFLDAVSGLENLPEGGERCVKCFELRLRATAALAKRDCYDGFTTTLSVSPHKDAKALNEIGERISAETGVAYITADFKKKDGYKKSIQLSEQFGLYRQNYCGCRFSKGESKGASI